MSEAKLEEISVGGVEEKNINPFIENQNLTGIHKFIAKLRDIHYRTKFLHSVWIALSLFTLGAIESQGGPTFLDLQLITRTDVEKASAFFTAHSCGYLTGSVVSGLSSKKINQSLLIFLSMCGMGSVTIITPHCSIYGLMVFVKFVAGIFGGLIDTTGNAEHMRIWGNDGQALMQLIHFFFALGGIISPLITEPFLAERPEAETVMNISLPSNSGNISGITEPPLSNDNMNFKFSDSASTTASHNISFNNSNAIMNLTIVPDNEKEMTTNVHYAFLITGIFSCVGSVPFLILFLQTACRSKQTTNKISKTKKVVCRKLPTNLHIFLVLCLCGFYVAYNCVEDSFAAFLMTFVVREFTFVSKSKAAYITAVYWACFAIARFVMIFVSRILSSLRLLLLSGVLMMLAFMCFTVSASHAAIAALTVFAGMAGLSMSAVFPAGMSWSESELLRVTPRVSAGIFVSASVANMLNPLAIAFLMEEITNMWFCYLMLIEIGAMSTVFIFLLIFNRCYVNKHYGGLYSVDVDGSQAAEDSDSEQFFVESGTEMKVLGPDEKVVS